MELALRHIAESVGGAIVGDDQVSIKGINSLPLAEKGEMSFLADPRLKDQIRVTKASAVIVKEFSSLYQGPQLIVSDPYLAYARVAAMFAPPIPRFPGISEKAIIGKGTHIGKDVSIYPFVWVGRESVIGNGVILFPGVYVGDRATVGDGSGRIEIGQTCLRGDKRVFRSGWIGSGPMGGNDWRVRTDSGRGMCC